MQATTAKEKRILEIMLIIVCLGLTCLLHMMHGYRMVILDLFFLPVVLAGFFLGRYYAGIMALFCVISASCVTALNLMDLAPPSSPLVMALAVTVWAAVLGLAALLVGTLSDDRTSKLKDLHDAYVGVVEVLAQYLQSANPGVKTRSIRVAELSQQIAAAMKLSPRQIDDTRVAALLYEMGNIQVTTKVIRRAVGNFENESSGTDVHTFQGADLMLSLGSVLSGAVPLLLNQDAGSTPVPIADPGETSFDVPMGAKIIRASRAYCTLTDSTLGIAKYSPAEMVKQLRDDREAEFDPEVLDALERIVSQEDGAAPVSVPPETTPQIEAPAEVAAT